MKHDWIRLLEQLDDRQLLRIGQIGAPCDYAVAHFRHASHPKLYRNRPALLKAVRRSMHQNFPDRIARMKREIADMLRLPETAKQNGGRQKIDATV